MPTLDRNRCLAWAGCLGREERSPRHRPASLTDCEEDVSLLLPKVARASLCGEVSRRVGLPDLLYQTKC